MLLKAHKAPQEPCGREWTALLPLVSPGWKSLAMNIGLPLPLSAIQKRTDTRFNLSLLLRPGHGLPESHKRLQAASGPFEGPGRGQRWTLRPID
jgi:hypothetical protein